VIAYHYWVQYHLSKQLTEAANYAASKGIVLKGDLPIGVDPLSVDVWTNPHLFRLHKQTGAPPDYFCTVSLFFFFFCFFAFRYFRIIKYK
jgi:4-alpha-glucanotransferase